MHLAVPRYLTLVLMPDSTCKPDRIALTEPCNCLLSSPCLSEGFCAVPRQNNPLITQGISSEHEFGERPCVRSHT